MSDSPSDYELFHYGIKGMKWGVIRSDRNGDGRIDAKKDKTSSRSSSSKKGPSKEPSSDQDGTGSNSRFAKAAKEFYSEKSTKDLNAEGKAKLKAQAESDFPEAPLGKFRQKKLDRINKDIAATNQTIAEYERKIEKGGKTLQTALNRRELKEQKRIRDAQLKDADAVQKGRFTSGEKKAIAVGAVAATGILAVYGAELYMQRKAGLSRAVVAQATRTNQLQTKDQWKTLFGNDASFSGPAAHGNFFAGLKNQKAFDRPEFTIPKGTSFQRLSNVAEDISGYSKGAYATFLANDSTLYGSSMEFGGKKVRMNFQASGDVRVPDLNTVVKHLKPLISNGNADDKIVIQAYQSLSGGAWNKSPLGQSLFDSLKKAGYSAIVDDMDAGVMGDLPIVFFGDVQNSTATPREMRDKLLAVKSKQKLVGQFV